MSKQQCSATKKAIKILKILGFVGGNINPCLYIKKSAKGIVYKALYLDDNLMVGNIDAIDNAISAVKTDELVLKVMERLQDFMSYKIKFSEDKKRA